MRWRARGGGRPDAALVRYESGGYTNRGVQKIPGNQPGVYKNGTFGVYKVGVYDLFHRFGVYKLGVYKLCFVRKGYTNRGVQVVFRPGGVYK